MSGALLVRALADLRDDIDRATADLARSIGDSLDYGSTCLSDDVRDFVTWQNALHDIRVTIEDSLREYRLRVERARASFKGTLSPLVREPLK